MPDMVGSEQHEPTSLQAIATAFRYRKDAEAFYRVLPKRLKKFNLEVAPEKTRRLRFSRYHPSMTRRFTFLGLEFLWKEDRQGKPRVMRRTARKKLQGACRRIREWIKLNRHLPGRKFFDGLNAWLRGHYNYHGVRGNARALSHFYGWARDCAFKWLNRRGGRPRRERGDCGAQGRVGGEDAEIAVKAPPCCHCPIARASSFDSRPRAREHVQQAPAHLRLHLGDGVGLEPGGGMENDPARGGGVEHAVEDDTVKV